MLSVKYDIAVLTTAANWHSFHHLLTLGTFLPLHWSKTSVIWCNCPQLNTSWKIRYIIYDICAIMVFSPLHPQHFIYQFIMCSRQ